MAEWSKNPFQRGSVSCSKKTLVFKRRVPGGLKGATSICCHTKSNTIITHIWQVRKWRPREVKCIAPGPRDNECRSWGSYPVVWLQSVLLITTKGIRRNFIPLGIFSPKFSTSNQRGLNDAYLLIRCRRNLLVIIYSFLFCWRWTNISECASPFSWMVLGWLSRIKSATFLSNANYLKGNKEQ